MENTINNNIDANEPIVDETETIGVEEIELEATEADDRPRGRGRGRRGMHGRRPFGPNRPYRFALFVEEDGSFVLRSPDLKEQTRVASLDDVGATMQVAIAERAAEDAAAQAEAEKDEQFSGKFVLRLPRSMHRQLTEMAEAEGVSLNQLALAFLAEGMGRAEMAQEFGGRRGGHRGPRGGHGPEGRGPEGRGRGGRGGFGPEGRGPEGWGGPGEGGPRGGQGRGGQNQFRGPQGRFDGRGDSRSEWGGRGRGPRFDGPQGCGPRRQRWFESQMSNATETPDTTQQHDTSFV